MKKWWFTKEEAEKVWDMRGCGHGGRGESSRGEPVGVGKIDKLHLYNMK